MRLPEDVAHLVAVTIKLVTATSPELEKSPSVQQVALNCVNAHLYCDTAMIMTAIDMGRYLDKREKGEI